MHQAPACSRPTALYVEDRSINVLLMQALFERLPEARLVVARDGAQALQLAHGLRPHLLLLDINLPDCQGTTLLEQLRELADYRDVHAVAVTAESRQDFEQYGFAETWLKPLNLPRTLVRLRLLLGVGVRAPAAGSVSLGSVSASGASSS